MKHPQDPQGVPALSLWPRDPRRVERDVHLGKQRTGRARQAGWAGHHAEGHLSPNPKGLHAKASGFLRWPSVQGAALQS